MGPLAGGYPGVPLVLVARGRGIALLTSNSCHDSQPLNYIVDNLHHSPAGCPSAQLVLGASSARLVHTIWNYGFMYLKQAPNGQPA